MKRCTRDYQARIAADPVVGLRWSKAPNSMGKISTAEVPSATLGTGSSTPRHQAVYHEINL
jgi:hypothetical protein